MNALVIGNGGREHALVWALSQSAGFKKIFSAPGNAGIARISEAAPVDTGDAASVIRFVREKDIGLTVIGPEAPLVAGLADAIRGAGGEVFGPGREAARLEGSKAFAKEFMRRHRLPTADFRVFDGIAEARAFAAGAPAFRVVKADGLAAGKGVVVARDDAETAEALESMLVRRSFGSAGARVVLEEALEGEELSVMALTDGRTIVPLLPTQDHKRAFDGDQGPNTGGMGAYGPVPQVSDELWGRIEREILGPFLEGLKKDRLAYRGVIYVGLMLTAEGPRVLEFNVRFGDPETEVILPMGEGDWGELLLATAQGRLAGQAFRARPGAAVTVIMASEGYPGDPRTGRPIAGLDAAEAEKDVLVFHAGTGRAEAAVVTAGGRVLAVTGLGRDIPAARERAYAGVRKIRFDGAHHRTDIGARALAALPPPSAK